MHAVFVKVKLRINTLIKSCFLYQTFSNFAILLLTALLCLCTLKHIFYTWFTHFSFRKIIIIPGLLFFKKIPRSEPAKTTVTLVKKKENNYTPRKKSTLCTVSWRIHTWKMKAFFQEVVCVDFSIIRWHLAKQHFLCLAVCVFFCSVCGKRPGHRAGRRHGSLWMETKVNVKLKSKKDVYSWSNVGCLGIQSINAQGPLCSLFFL